MHSGLTLIFFEDHVVPTILPNEGAWETLRVGGAEQLPLYFYVSGGEVRNDSFARERWEAGDTAAFGNFYETILDSAKTFRRFDLELPAVQLLHDVLGRLRADYGERMRAFDDTRTQSDEAVSLRLCFAPGISRDARECIRDYLSAQGFAILAEVDYLDALMCGLHKKGIVPGAVNIALIEAEFGDMRFDYLEWDRAITRRAREIISARGVDQRVGILARLMVEKAARKTTSTLLNDRAMLDAEIKRFHARAATLVEQFEYDTLETKVELSDNTPAAKIRIDRAELEGHASEAFHFIKHRFEKFIGNHSSLARMEKILLNGKAVSSPDFVRFFQRSFGTSKVIVPIANIPELISRGVFALSQPAREAVDRTVEIKITVTTKEAPGNPAVAAVTISPPPLPPATPARPPLPPATAVAPLTHVPKPPLPPSPRVAPVNARTAQPLPIPPTPPLRPPAPPRNAQQNSAPPAPPPPPTPAKRKSTRSK